MESRREYDMNMVQEITALVVAVTMNIQQTCVLTVNGLGRRGRIAYAATSANSREGRGIILSC